MPKEFKKGNLSITDNATISKEPEALDPIAEDPDRFRSVRLQDLQTLDVWRRLRFTQKRGLYNPLSLPLDGIHAAIVRRHTDEGCRRAAADYTAKAAQLILQPKCYMLMQQLASGS